MLMTDSTEDLIRKLRHFEKAQLQAGDEYGAEVLHWAAERLRELEEKNAQQVLRRIEYEGQFLDLRQRAEQAEAERDELRRAAKRLICILDSIYKDQDGAVCELVRGVPAGPPL